ncbi:hypothetical protein ABZP36_031878 [Zizania latifolia]
MLSFTSRSILSHSFSSLVTGSEQPPHVHSYEQPDIAAQAGGPWPRADDARPQAAWGRAGPDKDASEAAASGKGAARRRLGRESGEPGRGTVVEGAAAGRARQAVALWLLIWIEGLRE